MLDLADKKVSYYSSEDIQQVIYNLLEEGDEKEAMRACNIGLDQHPDDQSLELVKAKVLLYQHQYDEATFLLQNNPEKSSPFGIGIQFGISIATGDQREAFERLLTYLKAGNLTSLEFIEIVDELFEHLPHQLTSEYIRKAFLHVTNESSVGSEQDAEALGRMGALMMDSNCIKEAVPILEKALDVDAYDVYSWQDLTRCQFELQMYDECRNSCEMGLAVDPSNPLFHFVLGHILFHSGEVEASIEHLEQTRLYVEGKLKHEELNLDKSELDHQISLTYEMLGNAYKLTGENDKSQECYEMLVQRVPSFADGFYRLSLIATEKGDTPQALKSIDEALDINPENSTYEAFRVTLLNNLHRFEEALSGIDHLVKLEPKSKVYLLAKAQMALNMHHYKEADDAYRKLLKLKPKDETTRELMRAYFESIGDEEALKKLS